MIPNANHKDHLAIIERLGLRVHWKYNVIVMPKHWRNSMTHNNKLYQPTQKTQNMQIIRHLQPSTKFFSSASVFSGYWISRISRWLSSLEGIPSCTPKLGRKTALNNKFNWNVEEDKLRILPFCVFFTLFLIYIADIGTDGNECHCSRDIHRFQTLKLKYNSP